LSARLMQGEVVKRIHSVCQYAPPRPLIAAVSAGAISSTRPRGHPR
jgi:hypothetical protein